MGKVRVKTLGDEEAEKKQKEEERKRREAKIAEAKAEGAKAEAAEGSESLEAKGRETPSSTATKPEEDAPKKKPVIKQRQSKKSRSKSYQEAVTLVDRNKTYKLDEALAVLPKLKRAKFDETVELHINTTDKGISGQVSLPHGTGKKVRVAIATDDVITQVEKGVIDFDVLIAEPAMMPRLARVAKFLGPRGLMPNPKNGTISPTPQEVAKKFEAGQVTFKTESKFPLLHLTVGKMSFGEEKLSANIKTLIGAVKTKNIKDATLKSTMSPGIKLDVASL